MSDPDRRQLMDGSRGKGRGLWLWATWFFGPFAWALDQSAGYVLVGRACSTGDLLPLYGISLLALGIAAAGLIVGGRLYVLTRKDAVPDGTSGRSSFIALAGVLISALSLTGIALESLPLFLTDPCASATAP